jgi:hypothetical protein
MLLAQQASGIGTAEGDDPVACEHRAFDDPVDQCLLHRPVTLRVYLSAAGREGASRL